MVICNCSVHWAIASTTLIFLKVPDLINEEVGINVEGGIFLGKKLVHNCNKRGVEGGKNLRNQKRGGWKCAWRVDFFFQNQ